MSNLYIKVRFVLFAKSLSESEYRWYKRKLPREGVAMVECILEYTVKQVMSKKRELHVLKK